MNPYYQTMAEPVEHQSRVRVTVEVTRPDGSQEYYAEVTSLFANGAYRTGAMGEALESLKRAAVPQPFQEDVR